VERKIEKENRSTTNYDAFLNGSRQKYTYGTRNTIRVTEQNLSADVSLLPSLANVSNHTRFPLSKSPESALKWESTRSRSCPSAALRTC
jgi:hypothetical protein